MILSGRREKSPMSIVLQDKESVGNLVKLIDKSNGYIFSSIDGSAVEFSKVAAAPLDWDYYRYPFLKFSSLLLLVIIPFIYVMTRKNFISGNSV